jgi:flagellar motility protein MotE (MotC chaperone)
MKSGYDQFFKTAKKSSSQSTHAMPAAKNKKTSSQKNPKKSFPVKSMMMFFVLIFGVMISIQFLDKIEDFFSSLEITMSSAIASDAPVAKGEVKTAATGPSSPEAPKDKAEEKPVVSSDDPTDYLFKLADRKRELDKREAELDRREEEVTKLKAEIEEKLVELKSYRNNISTLLQDRVSSDAAKVETLVQVYSNMKPSQAAKVFETMDEDLVIEILSKMKKKSAADILNLVKSDKAQVLAEKYAGYRLVDRKVAGSNNNSNSPVGEDTKENQQSTKEESDQ